MALTGGATPYLQCTPAFAPYPQMTVGAWVKLPASATATNTEVLLCPDSGFGYQFDIHWSGVPTPSGFGSIAKSNNGTTINGTGTGTISNLVWHFICSTFDNGGTAGQVATVKIYWDGALNNTITLGGPVTALLNTDGTSFDYIFPGGSVDGGAAVDYVMVWKRLVSAAEITALYPSGDPRVVAPANLVSFASLQSSGTNTDLVSAKSWVPTGAGSLTVVAPPFALPAAGGTKKKVLWWRRRHEKIPATPT